MEEGIEVSLNVTASPEEDTSRYTLKLCLSIAYFALWIIGSIGNGIVIVMIINVLTSRKRKHVQRRKQAIGSNTNHVFIYILGLSIVDFLVIMHLPFLVADLLQGQWLFGSFMCKIYWFGESVNKLLSSFIMTVLSWDRYLAVCSPVTSLRIRSNSVSIGVLLACSIFATVLLIPVMIQATVYKIDRMLMIQLEEDSEQLRLSDLRGTTMSKCMFDADATFTLYTFVIGFIIPAILITLFYSLVIYKVQKSSKGMRALRAKPSDSGRKDTDRVKMVTKRIVAVVIFYYFCWTPQWTLNIMTQFNFIHPSWMTPALSALFFIAHLLVCFNSAANPLLYALINRELRQQHVRALQKKRQSVSHGAREFLHKQRLSYHRNSAMSVVSVSTIKSERGFLGRTWGRLILWIRNLRRKQGSLDGQSSASNCTRASIEERTKTDGYSSLPTVPEIVISDSGDDYL